MLQEKIVKDINKTLHQSLSKSFINEFASRLNVNLKPDGAEGGDQELIPPLQDNSRSSPISPNQRAGFREEVNRRDLQEQVEPEDLRMMKRLHTEQQQSQHRLEPIAIGDIQLEEVEGKGRKFAERVKNLVTVTDHDIIAHQRQKGGKLRIGDVVMLAFHFEVHREQMDDERRLIAMQSYQDAQRIKVIKPQRSLSPPDFKYKGFVFSNGVSDQGMSVIPKINNHSKNATNMFKQCLFRVEVQQQCSAIKKEKELLKKRAEKEQVVKRIQRRGEGELNHKDDFKDLMPDVLEELKEVEEQLAIARKERKIQEENNRYERVQTQGQKVTYGQPIQLLHLFSQKYLSLSQMDMSDEFGCCKLVLNEGSEESWFCFQSAQPLNEDGQVIHLNDYFYVKSFVAPSQFFLHVSMLPNKDPSEDIVYELNAGYKPSPIKANLFMTHQESKKQREFIQSGDVIRLKHFETNGYVTTSQKDIVEYLPEFPDFLKAQIWRVKKGEKRIEVKPGEVKASEFKQGEIEEMLGKNSFKRDFVNYRRADGFERVVKELQKNVSHRVYIERSQERLLFTNSCWEIQRVNPLKGGNIIFQEWYRLRHVGTGKFLAVSENDEFVELRMTPDSVRCIFKLRLENSSHRQLKEAYLDPMGIISNEEEVAVIQNQLKYVKSGQRAVINSFSKQDCYLQSMQDCDSQELEKFRDKAFSLNTKYLNMEQEKETQTSLITHSFQAHKKERMVFMIEEVPVAQSLYSYVSSSFIVELLKFYAFLNSWGVEALPQSQQQQLEEFFYDHEKSIQDCDLLYEKCQRMLGMMENLENIIDQIQDNDSLLEKCKVEIVEQGVMDVLCNILELIYYKSTPPPLFKQPFADKSTDQNLLANLDIQNYVAQEICKNNTEDLQLKILTFLLDLVRSSRQNSERMTKFFGILYQIMQINDEFLLISQKIPNFSAGASRRIVLVIQSIFVKSQKNAMYIFEDRSSECLQEVDKQRNTKTKINEILPQQNSNSRQTKLLTIDSKMGQELIKNSKKPNQMKKWLNLLEPVRFKSKSDQNIERQIMYMKVISMFCRDQDHQGVFPYQIQAIEHILDNEENIPLKFGLGKVSNLLRPFVYFNRPKALISISKFVENNPILGEVKDFNMIQRGGVRYELVFDLHELTKNYETKGKETWPYIEYICAVLNLYSHLCLSSNVTAIEKIMSKAGIKEDFILQTIGEDTDRLQIHEKLKQSFMELTKHLFIQNNPVAPGTSLKNRCYVWDRLDGVKGNPNIKYNIEDQLEEENDIGLENNWYKDGKWKKKIQMDNPDLSMELLRHNSNSKDFYLIRLIKQRVINFLKDGPKNTDEFFYDSKERNFEYSQLKVKIRSLEIYLDVVLSLIAEDCVDNQFITYVQDLCLSIVLASTELQEEDQIIEAPKTFGNSWVFKLVEVVKRQTKKKLEGRKMKNAIRAIEMKVLQILEKLGDYRLDTQVTRFLKIFRRFQLENADPSVVTFKTVDLDILFQRLFEPNHVDDFIENQTSSQTSQALEIFGGKDEGSDNTDEVKIAPVFDLFLLQYIFKNESSYIVRVQALKVLIKYFGQRRSLVNELTRTDLIVGKEDLAVYTEIIVNHDQIKKMVNKLVYDEITHMVNQKSPALDTWNTCNDLICLLAQTIEKLYSVDPVMLRKLQNILKHIGISETLLNVLMKELIYNEFQHRILYQKVVDFLFILCYQNTTCQQHLMPHLNLLLELMNMEVNSGLLISEVIKCNRNPQFTKSFTDFIVNKIVGEGKYYSSLFKQLIWLSNPGNQQGGDFNKLKVKDTSNQEYVIKQVISHQKFRTMVYMKRQWQERKIKMITSFCKRQESYNQTNKEPDSQLINDREIINSHLSIVDLVSACARGSAFGVQQAQKLVECEELLDSILAEQIPFIIKKHYFSLLFEVYLRKVPGLNSEFRIQISDLKFAQILKWIVDYDLTYSFHYYTALVNEPQLSDPPEKQRKIKQVLREIERAQKADFDELNMMKTEKDKIEERAFKASLSSIKDLHSFKFLNSKDHMEFWIYLLDLDKNERKKEGLLPFLERLYREYQVRELMDENIQKITIQIRERLNKLLDRLKEFLESHGDNMKPIVLDIINQLDLTIRRLPEMRSFIVGRRRIIENQKMQVAKKALIGHQEESGVLDPNVCSQKVLRILRDYAMNYNVSIAKMLNFDGSKTSMFVTKYDLIQNIRFVAGVDATYDEIKSAIIHFSRFSAEKQRERDQVMSHGDQKVETEIPNHLILFRDVEVLIYNEIKKTGIELPDRNEIGNKLVLDIPEKVLALRINMDLRLFVHRFFEFVHSTNNVFEIHQFVHKVMSSGLFQNHESRFQLISNLISCFSGLSGIDDELTLISILTVILQRLTLNQNEVYLEGDLTSQQKMEMNRMIKMKKELRDWQGVMMEAKVPELMLKFISCEVDSYLSNRALNLINCILYQQDENNQRQFLEILKANNKFFKLFYYLKQRLSISKEYLIQKVLEGALQKFEQREEKILQMGGSSLIDIIHQFQREDVSLDPKYNMEEIYQNHQNSWRTQEIEIILRFLNLLCENCFRPAQLFLKQQEIVDFSSHNSHHLSSIDLIRQVVVVLIETVDQLGDYLFSDLRTQKLIPSLIDTMIEFIYGPCIENQVFLGSWKSLIQVINKLMCQKNLGNYGGIFNEAKSRLQILSSCSQILLAIMDIKEERKRNEVLFEMLEILDVDNLIEKMVDIYIFKIGGTQEKQEIYKFEKTCQHYQDASPARANYCIKDEYCQFNFLIPRDKVIIKTGFNIFQTLMLLKQSFPDHPKLKKFGTDLIKQDSLFSNYNQLYAQVTKGFIESSNSKSSEQTLQESDKYHKKLLDEIIIKYYPDNYLDYLQKLQDLKPYLKHSVINLEDIEKAKSDKQVKDYSRLLMKVRDTLESEFEKSVNGGQDPDDTPRPQALIDLKPVVSEQKKNFLRNLQVINLSSISGGVKTMFSQRTTVVPQGHVLMSEGNILEDKEELIEKKPTFVSEDESKVQLFKFYLAYNFYEDNIGKVEIVQQDSTIIETSFPIPPFTFHLTNLTRDDIPNIAFQVSQQEKIEALMRRVPEYQTEMLWQKRLGQISISLKTFANSWEYLSTLNFLLIIFVNSLYIAFIKPGDQGSIDMEQDWQNILVTLISMFQTAVAFIVVLSHYVEYRANYHYLLSQNYLYSERTDLGINRGSLAYGKNKTGRKKKSANGDLLQIWLKKFPILKVVYQILREIGYFFRAVGLSPDHGRNIIYLVVSFVGNYNRFFTALLLIDVVYKIPQLRQVLSIFNENKIHLLAVLCLFIVVLYLYAFFAFVNFSNNFEHKQPGDDNGPDYNMYCDTLVRCLLSTINLGIRSGGGLGDALAQPAIEDPEYYVRYVFDILFFLIVTTVLMNIFFGIIIDSFADKRAQDQENVIERKGKCFICGISKSQFDIANVPWKEHIFKEHNLHSYLAFVIYVNMKHKGECTGAEKWVKEQIINDLIEFFPINRALKVDDGKVMEE